MTVTELREAFQKLEAEGKGALQVVYLGEHKGNPMLWETNEPQDAVADEWDDAPKGPCIRI